MSRRSTLGFAMILSLALAACGGGAGASTGGSAPPASEAPTSTICMPTTEAATVEVAIRRRAFSPGVVQAKVGDVVAFTNEDAVPHTATLDDEPCTTENLGQGATGALTFTEPGEYPFHCRIHSDMTGTFEIS